MAATIMNKDNDNFIGLTLLFIERLGGRREALLKSYVLSRPQTFDELMRECEQLGTRQNSGKMARDKNAFVYLGVEDSYCVAGSPLEGAMLGRTTLWDHETKNSAITLVRPPTNHVFHKQ